MIDRGKVLQALAQHGRGECITEDVVCPYWGINVRDDAYACFRQLCMDAAELLKEQEPVEPIYKDVMPFCGNCKHAIAKTVNYCPKCGRAVKWE